MRMQERKKKQLKIKGLNTRKKKIKQIEIEQNKVWTKN